MKSGPIIISHGDVRKLRVLASSAVDIEHRNAKGVLIDFESHKFLDVLDGGEPKEIYHGLNLATAWAVAVKYLDEHPRKRYKHDDDGIIYYGCVSIVASVPEGDYELAAFAAAWPPEAEGDRTETEPDSPNLDPAFEWLERFPMSGVE